MKTFEMTHLVFKNTHVFNEDEPPNWLLSKEFRWWYIGYVLELKVGDHIDSDFQRFKRIT